MPIDLESFFSDDQIIETLCSLRIAAARKRHKRHLLHNISATPINKPKSIESLDGERYSDIQQLYSMMPPRRMWKNMRIRHRKNRASTQIDKIALKAIISQRRKSRDDRDLHWLTNLENFVGEVQGRVLGQDPYYMGKFQVTPIKKKPNDEDCKKYRAIGKYINLIDQVVDKLCAKYLRELVDSSFLECSYAFRARNQHNLCPSRHDAVKRLIEYREKYVGEALWVSECDIQKFFDCVNHDEAIKALHIATTRTHSCVDSRAQDIFEAYLNSYSFETVALAQAEIFFKAKGIEGEIEECEDLKSLYNNFPNHKIGIPQGGAISCVIVNLMLDQADRMVLEDLNDSSLLYLRYCDDIVIIHTEENKCKDALDRYLLALESLKLVPHAPKEIDIFSKDFWGIKSKLPYKWLYDPTDRSSVPWVAFVGYHVRCDSLLRIRYDSIKKELDKQVKEASEILKIISPATTSSISPKIRRTRGYIQHSLNQRLISMAVGRINLSTSSSKLRDLCWCSGFKLLSEHRYILDSQLKQLDRGRGKQLRRVRKKLRKINIEVEGVRSERRIKYYGNRFSYHAQFLHKDENNEY